jgi:hypothetical protein
MLALSVPEMVGVATLVAVITIVLMAGTATGGVYKPDAEIVPVAALPPATPLIAQVTDWLVAPATAAEYCPVVPTLTVDGPVMVTAVPVPPVLDAACKAMERMPDTEEFAALTAVMVTAGDEGIDAGAENSPAAEMVP